MARVLEHRSLYSHPRFHSAFPSICALPNGGPLLVAFRRGRDPRWLLGSDDRATSFGLSHWDPRSHLALLRLDRHTFAPLGEPTQVLPDPEAAEQDPSLFVTSTGRVLLGSFGWYPVPSSASALVLPAMVTGQSNDSRIAAHLTTFVPWGASLRSSDDGATTFSGPTNLPVCAWSNDPHAVRRGAYRGGLRGSMAERGGEIHLAVYEAIETPASVHIYTSFNGGLTFAPRAVAVRDMDRKAGFQEPALIATPNGDLVVFCRTSGLDDALATARSADGGITWSPYTKHGFQGHPYHPLRLRDGRLLLAYGYRHKPYGIRARIIDPEARGIDEAEEIVLRADGTSPDCGYPWSVELDDGSVLVAYYWIDGDDKRTICATRLALS